jgi:hypothetical protein
MSSLTELVRVGRDLPRYNQHGLTDETMHICSRGRIYTTQPQRRRLSIDGYGYGTELSLLVRTSVGLVGDSCAGGRYCTARVRLCENGEFVLPYAARQYLDVGEGDTVCVTATVDSA